MKPLLLRLLLAACCGLVFFSSGAAAQTLADKVREATLANGLKLLVVERHDAPTFSAYLSIGVGGVDETSRTRGVAHLLEHMLFKGTRRIGTRDWAKEEPLLGKIEAVGSRIDELKDAPGVDPSELGNLRRQLAALQAEHRKLVVKDEFSRIYAENGGVGYNASTSKDMTTYVISLAGQQARAVGRAGVRSDAERGAARVLYRAGRGHGGAATFHRVEPGRHALREAGGQRLQCPSLPQSDHWLGVGHLPPYPGRNPAVPA